MFWFRGHGTKSNVYLCLSLYVKTIQKYLNLFTLMILCMSLGYNLMYNRFLFNFVFLLK